jgi:predicted nucleotidyltransferase
VADLDAIRWLTLGDDDRRRLHAAAARVLGTRDWVKAAYLYGSAARGQPARDIDIGLVADPVREHWSDLASIAEEFAALLERPAADFDVRILNGGDPVFLGRVMQDRVLLYEHDLEARVQFEVHAANLWLDFRPLWERHRERVLAKWSHA